MKNLSEAMEPSGMWWSFSQLRLALLLVLLVLGSSALYAQEAADQQANEQEKGVRDKLFQIEDWSGYSLVTELEDGTSLFSYVAETFNLPVEGSDRAEHNAIYRFTFFARFQCSPLIELIGTMPEDTNEDTRVAVLRNFNQLAISIDKEDHEFPVFVEQRGKDVHSYYNANLEGRNTMKIYVEIGDQATITYGDGNTANFSLAGSRKALAQASGRCRSHQ